MNSPSSISHLVQQITNELDFIEHRANWGLAIACQLLEQFPSNTTLIGLSANLGNGLFFTHSFKTRIDTMIQGFSMQPSSTESVQQLGEELSEILGRVLECKMTVDRSVSILERLQ
jgi:hypothetical protein